jgi:hypothetical protein
MEKTETAYELIFKFEKAPGKWIYSMDDINMLLENDDSMPLEWRKWREGKSNYKPFRLQMTECKESGNLFTEDCCHCGGTLLLCKRYGGQCISGKCRHERIREQAQGV